MQSVAAVLFISLLASVGAETASSDGNGFFASLVQEAENDGSYPGRPEEPEWGDSKASSAAQEMVREELADARAASGEAMVPKKKKKGPKPKPIFADAGGDFDGSATFVNLKEKGLSIKLGPGFSFFAKIKYTKLNSWSRIFDFGYPTNKYNVMAGNIAETAMMFFEVHPADEDATPISMHSRDVMINVNEENAYLFVIKETGMMEIWRDGYRLLEKTGVPLPVVDRPNLFIGKPNWQHPGGNDELFSGSIRDIRIFNQAVEWDAVSEQKTAVLWPGLINGIFATAIETTPVQWTAHRPPFGWDAEGDVTLATLDGVKTLGGPLANDGNEEELAVALMKGGSEIRQYVQLLQRGKKYWVSFDASAAEGTEALMSITVDDEEYISGVDFDHDEFSNQYFAFVAIRKDGKALLKFKNTSPESSSEEGEGHSAVFVRNVRISDAPHCYKLFKSQAKCVHEEGALKEVKKEKGMTEVQCRKMCEDAKCLYMMFDPVTYSGSTYCEIYPDCNMMSMYYGGEAGHLYARVPCAAGGHMSPEAAKLYRLPVSPEAAKLEAVQEAANKQVQAIMGNSSGNGTNQSAVTEVFAMPSAEDSLAQIEDDSEPQGEKGGDARPPVPPEQAIHDMSLQDLSDDLASEADSWEHSV